MSARRPKPRKARRARTRRKTTAARALVPKRKATADRGSARRAAGGRKAAPARITRRSRRPLAPEPLVAVAQPAGAPPVVTPLLVMGILPVRHTVLFPHALLPLSVGRAAGVRLLNDVMATDRTIAVF